MKLGSKLKSQVYDSEVMVVRAAGAIECGGVAMDIAKPAALGEVAADHAGDTLMGKRYVDIAGIFELLRTKPGKGALAVNDAKPLPASD